MEDKMKRLKGARPRVMLILHPKDFYTLSRKQYVAFLHRLGPHPQPRILPDQVKSYLLWEARTRTVPDSVPAVVEGQQKEPWPWGQTGLAEKRGSRPCPCVSLDGSLKPSSLFPRL